MSCLENEQTITTKDHTICPDNHISSSGSMDNPGPTECREPMQHSPKESV